MPLKVQCSLPSIGLKLYHQGVHTRAKKPQLISVLFIVYFHSFQTILQSGIVDFRRIQTLVVRVEGEQADHLTTPRPNSH